METMRSWWLAGENVSSGATKAKDGSWIRPAKSTKIVRLEETVALIENALKEHEGRVRALVGFSQGATLIGILKRVKPELFENVRRVVSVAGFDPLDEEEDTNFTTTTTNTTSKAAANAFFDDSIVERIKLMKQVEDESLMTMNTGGGGLSERRNIRNL